MTHFPCTKCGLCCRRLYLNPNYADLNRGDGICKHLEEETNLCKIYEQRPLKCNINDVYDKLLKTHYSLKEYYLLNAKQCLQWQNEENLENIFKIDISKF